MTEHGADAFTRKSFLATFPALGVAAAWRSAEGGPGASRPAAPGFPRNDPARVQAVVGASHSNLDRVRELVTEQPALAKASWDWGFGDWETALGAASHTGRREIAELLIAHGARPTVFSAAMMGELATVRAFLEADPGLFRLHGPHGISLTRHALAGGPDAEDVVAYLEERFGPDESIMGLEGTDALEARYGGRFAFATEPATTVAVAVRNGWLLVGAGEQPNSRVLQVSEDVFHPTGAPGVRLRFGVTDGRAVTLTVEDGPTVVTGQRVE